MGRGVARKDAMPRNFILPGFLVTGDFPMRTASKVIAAVILVLLAAPALAASAKDTADCEQMTNPALKIAACTTDSAIGEARQ